jgi:hypothetical protein
VSAGALTVLVVVVVVVIMVVVMMMVLVFILVIVVVVMVVMLVLVIVIVVVMMMVMLVFIVIIIVIVVIIVVMVMPAGALAVLVIVVVMLMLMLVLLTQNILQALFRLDGTHEGCRVKLVPRRGDDSRVRVQGAQKLFASRQLLGREVLGTGEDDGGCRLNLVVVELAEVLGVHLALCRVNNGGAPDNRQLRGAALDSLDNVGELANAARLDDNAVGVELLRHLLERLAEVADKTAADAAAVHLGYLDARLAQEAAVDADFAELVFDENNLLALPSVGEQLFDKGGLSGAEEAGENVNFCHLYYLFAI